MSTTPDTLPAWALDLAPHRGHEPLSPFVTWAAEERGALPSEAQESGQPQSLVVDVLRDPAAVVEQLLDPARTPSLVVGSVAMVMAGTSFFSAAAAAAQGGSGVLATALAAGANVLVAMAAAVGPIYAASILVAARVPLGRLVAALLSCAATGSLVLAGMGPLAYVLWQLDDVWAGPLALVGGFGVAGMAAGVRLHHVLTLMAKAVTRATLRDPTAGLSPGDTMRVGILARVSLMVVGFTVALAFWGFGAFLP
jgi:hypothetical protein